MAEGKWIADLGPLTPLADAARRALRVRLEVVCEYLPRSLHQPEKDPEYIHQLRVATRRARAALDIFAVCLPEKVHQTSRKQLRRIRRAAGAARDWDVFLLELAGWARRGRKPQPGIDFLIGHALAQRAAAQQRLVEADSTCPSGFDRLQARTVAAVHRPRPDLRCRTLIDLARPLLATRLQELEQAAARDLDDYTNLHQVRISGKRLRYAMEVFADCFAPRFREDLYPAVEEMQDILGRANDSHVASRRLREMREIVRATMVEKWKRYRPAVEKLLRFHDKRLREERKRFREWWKRWRELGSETTLANLLKAPGSPNS